MPFGIHTLSTAGWIDASLAMTYMRAVSPPIYAEDILAEKVARLRDAVGVAIAFVALDNITDIDYNHTQGVDSFIDGGCVFKPKWIAVGC